MALLAESLVDEWLNRQRFFTVRDVRHGIGEIDVLGVRPTKSGLEGWHVEVQASFRLIGYIAPLTDASLSGFAKSKTSMKARSIDLIETVIAVWVQKKFTSASKQAAREMAWPGLKWKYILVHAVVRELAELELIRSHGVEVIPLHQVLMDLGHGVTTGIKGGAGTDLSKLIEYFYNHSNITPSDQV